MTVSEFAAAPLERAARRAYERRRLEGALWRGAFAAAVAIPGFVVCGQTPWAVVCIAGFALVVTVGRVRGLSYEEGMRAGALAGILPCLLPAAVRFVDPGLCALVSSQGPWICGIGGVAAGVILGLRGRGTRGLPFWGSALAGLAFPASLGCLPTGVFGFLGLAIGMVAGGGPILASRRALFG